MRAQVAERLMGTALVVPADPLADRRARLDEALEVVLPDALLLELAEEALDHAVLLGRVGRDELLAQAVVAAGGAEAAGREDQAVVAPDDRRRALGPEGTEAGEAGLLEGALGFPGPAPQGELLADDLAVVAVDDRRQVAPAVLAAVDVGEVHRPALVARRRDARRPCDPRSRRDRRWCRTSAWP